jgi:hypothetical protein
MVYLGKKSHPYVIILHVHVLYVHNDSVMYSRPIVGDLQYNDSTFEDN